MNACLHCAKPNHSYIDCRSASQSDSDTITINNSNNDNINNYNNNNIENTISNTNSENDSNSEPSFETSDNELAYDSLNKTDSPYLPDLWDYYRNVYENAADCHVISDFSTKIFSGPLRRIVELVINDPEHIAEGVDTVFPVSESFWDNFSSTFCTPHVFVNGKKIIALVDTGASSSVMSFKFFNTETIRSLKLVFKGHTRTMKMADGNEVNTQGQLENVPFTVNDVDSSASPHVMNDLSYDLILGRDWCEANGVRS